MRPNEVASEPAYPEVPEHAGLDHLAEQNNLTLKVQQAIYNIAKQDVERAKAGHYPTLDLVAIYSDQKGVGGTITGRGST